MTITDIKSQRRSSERFSIYVDGAYAFGLSSSDAAMSGLRIGQGITEAEIEHFRKHAGLAKLYNSAVRFIGYRPRSRQEVEAYLRRKGFEATDIAEVIPELQRAHLVDDQAFAESWVTNRLLLRPRSRRVLQQELMLKGVAPDDIAGALEAMDSETELNLLIHLAERKRQQSQYREPAKLMAYLGRQGYSYDLIKKALARLDE